MGIEITEREWYEIRHKLPGAYMVRKHENGRVYAHSSRWWKYDMIRRVGWLTERFRGERWDTDTAVILCNPNDLEYRTALENRNYRSVRYFFGRLIHVPVQMLGELGEGT